ncbi:MAG: polysaccharide biosynthesis tyrosine autokinase [Kiritimatiellae bacterium]|nr:polysaccharide biosynthesis tyrosine autokinase [Kiritimatiellia bacterium]
MSNTNQPSPPPPQNPAPYGAPGPYYSGPYESSNYGEGSGTPSHGFLGELKPRRILRVMRRRWLTLTLTTGVALILAFFYLWFSPKIYSASALIEMSVRRPRIMTQPDAILDEQMWAPSDEVFNTRLEKFRGSTLRKIAVDVLADHPAFAGKSKEETAAAASGVSYTLVRNSRLVRVSASNTNPEYAAAVANAFASAAEALMIEENQRESDNAVTWLQAQASSQRKVLEQADQAVVDFREKNRMSEIESQASITAAALQEVSRNKTALENQQLLNRDLLTSLEHAELEPEAIGKLPSNTPRREAILTAYTRYTEAALARDALKTRLTPRHPDYLAAEKTVLNAQEMVAEAIRQARETVMSDDRLIEQQLNSLENRTAELSRQSSEFEVRSSQAKSNLAALEREATAAKISYEGILRRIEEARLSADENTAAVKQVEPARVPGAPVSPKPASALQMAILLGLVVGLLLALVLDVLEDVLEHDEDVEAHLGIKVLSVVPLEKNVNRELIALMCHKEKHSHFAEAFSGLRGVLDSGDYKNHSKVLLVTSTMPEVGKTISTTNLGISFAQRGERTLVVDFDMRRPRLRRVFGIPEDHESLAHALASRNAGRFEKLPFHTEITGMDVICSRAAGRDLSAGEVVGQKFVKEFMNWARERYDRVVLDSPPFGVVNDAVSLAALSDGVLLVLRPGKTRKSPTRNAIRHLSEVGTPILGVIVNGLDYKKASYFSKYDYHYSHYRYGYGDHYQTEG